MITAAFAERVTAVAGDSQCLSLFHALPVLYNERARRQMRVVTVLAVAVIDRNVVPEGAPAMVLLHSEIVRISGSALHRHHATAGSRRDVISMQCVPPMRKCAVRPLREHPRFSGCHR